MNGGRKWTLEVNTITMFLLNQHNDVVWEFQACRSDEDGWAFYNSKGHVKNFMDKADCIAFVMSYFGANNVHRVD